MYYIYIYIYIYDVYINKKLKVSCRFIDNLQLTNPNVKLLQCYDIFFKSRNLTCTEVKNTPHRRTDSAHYRTLQTPSTRQV